MPLVSESHSADVFFYIQSKEFLRESILLCERISLVETVQKQ